MILAPFAHLCLTGLFHCVEIQSATEQTSVIQHWDVSMVLVDDILLKSKTGGSLFIDKDLVTRENSTFNRPLRRKTETPLPLLETSAVQIWLLPGLFSFDKDTVTSRNPHQPPI